MRRKRLAVPDTPLIPAPVVSTSENFRFSLDKSTRVESGVFSSAG